MREKDFENQIKQYLFDAEAWYVKFFANRMTKSGIPDILACVNGYFVGIEVKAQSGHPSALQLHKCSEIRKAGGFAFIVYPSGFEQLKSFIKSLEKNYPKANMPMILK